MLTPPSIDTPSIWITPVPPNLLENFEGPAPNRSPSYVRYNLLFSNLILFLYLRYHVNHYLRCIVSHGMISSLKIHCTIDNFLDFQTMCKILK